MIERIRRRVSLWVIVTLAAGVGVIWLLLEEGGRFKDSIDQVSMSDKLGWEGGGVSLCVGRFIVNLPRGAVLKGTKGASGTSTISADSPITIEDFRRRVEGRWAVIRSRVLDDAGKPRVKLPEMIEVAPQGVIFNFDHAVTRGPDVTGKVGEWALNTSEGHLWLEGVAYTFDEGDEVDIKRSMLSLSPLHVWEVPAGPGFCGPRTFMPGPARPEFISVHAEWRTKVQMALRLSTSTYTDRIGLNSLRPPKPSADSLPKDDKMRGHLIQQGDVRIGALEGQEWIVGFTERMAIDEYRTSVTAIWFTEGAVSSSDRPAVQIRLSATYLGAAPPQTWGDFPNATDDKGLLSAREDFLHSWRTLLASFRLRPAAL